MNVVKHLENYLGEIDRSIKIINNSYNISVSIFQHQPCEGLKTFSTLGLNKYYLNYKSRFELIFICDSKQDENVISVLLLSISNYLIKKHTPILRGEVILLPNKIEKSEMNSLYVSLPFYFHDDFQTCKNEDEVVVFPLLIPIYEKEKELIERKGWECFEEFLVKNNVDNLWDFNREEYRW